MKFILVFVMFFVFFSFSQEKILKEEIKSYYLKLFQNGVSEKDVQVLEQYSSLIKKNLRSIDKLNNEIDKLNKYKQLISGD